MPNADRLVQTLGRFSLNLMNYFENICLMLGVCNGTPICRDYSRAWNEISLQGTFRMEAEGCFETLESNLWVSVQQSVTCHSKRIFTEHAHVIWAHSGLWRCTFIYCGVKFSQESKITRRYLYNKSL